MSSNNHPILLSSPILFNEVKALIKNKDWTSLWDAKKIAGDVPKDLPQTKIWSFLTLNVFIIQS